MRLPLAFVLALLVGPALAEPPRVVVDIAPVHALAAQVMEGVATPDLLLDQDANPHAVQLRPSQARMLSQADLLIWVGPDLEPWLQRLADGLDGDQIVLMDAPATTLRAFTPPAGADDAHHDHDHDATDPHVWLSVDNARAWLGLFAEDLAARDPENAATYRANAAKAQAGIDALTARIEARLSPWREAEVVTFHAAFGYFTDRFGPIVAGSVRPGDAATPSAAAMAALRDLVSTHDIACAYAEPAFDPGLLKAIASDTGLRIGTLDPTGALLPPGPDHYAATLEGMANGFAACLEGAEGDR